jgi:hypothetical protein
MNAHHTVPGRTSDREMSVMSSREARPDLQIRRPCRTKLEVSVSRILYPFRYKAGAKAGRDERHQRESIVRALGNVAGQSMGLEDLGK